MELKRERPATKTIKSFITPISETKQLESGHSVHISETVSIGVVRIELFWAAGNFHQNKTYVASLANDLLFSGNETRSEFEVVEFLDFLGATHRTECGTLGSSVVIRASKKNIIRAFNWVVENIINASYPEKELETAKIVRMASLERQQKTPKYWANRLALEHLYGEKNPLGAHGDLDDYENITRDDLIAFKNEFYTLNKSMVFVSGDTDKQLIENINLTLKNHPGQRVTIDRPDSGESQAIPKDPIVHHLAGTNQVSIQMVSHVKPQSQRDRYGLTLLNLVLGGYFGSRLMQILREEKGLTYGIGSYFKPAFNEYTWTISGDLNSTNITESIATIHEIFESLRTTNLEEGELDKIKQYYSGQFRSGFDGPFSMGGKIQHLMYRDLSSDYYDSVLTNIWSITPLEVKELANNYLHTNSFIQVMAGDTP